MSTIVLEATSRTVMGKGASRRLRRLENLVPGIVYGGEKEPHLVNLSQNKVIKALETESIYSSVFDLKLDGKTEKVILKDLQRHPYKPVILHMDLQRVSAKDVLIKKVPIHFINEEGCKGVKLGGLINHAMTEVEVKCQAKNLPEFIEVDLTDVDLDAVVHLSQLKLPKGVELSIDVSDSSHDHPVVSIHTPRSNSEEVAAEAEAVAEPAAGQTEAE